MGEMTDIVERLERLRDLLTNEIVRWRNARRRALATGIAQVEQ